MDLERISTSFEDILQEVQTMRLCEDENVLRCYCSFVFTDQLWLVTQLMDKGSCFRVMTVARGMGFGEGMNEEWLAYILKEALQGIKYLHDNGQIHRDIKSGNILLDSRGGVRIADFGVSGWTMIRGERQESVKTFVGEQEICGLTSPPSSLGTPCWMAPEVMEQLDGYDHKADIWSLGITALELAKGSAPYAKYPPMRVIVLTIEEDPPSLKTYENDRCYSSPGHPPLLFLMAFLPHRQRTGAPFSKLFEDFIKKALNKVPSQRASAADLLKHKFLKGRTQDALVHQLLDQIPAVSSTPLSFLVPSSLSLSDWNC
jgi:serine/threonine-protein kinase OSR1/STK39